MVKSKLYIDISKNRVYDKKIIGTPKGAKLINSELYFINTNQSPSYHAVKYDKKEKAYLLEGYKNTYINGKPIKNKEWDKSNQIIFIKEK